VRILEKKRREVKKSLEGNYSKVYLALLAENMRLWEEYQASIKRVEEEIGKLLEELCPNIAGRLPFRRWPSSPRGITWNTCRKPFSTGEYAAPH
jgi:hypothetical protein